MNYFSSVKTKLKEKFSQLDIWKNEEWYSAIRYSLDASFIRKCIELGKVAVFTRC